MITDTPPAAGGVPCRITERRTDGFANAGPRAGADRGRPAAVQEADRAERDESRAAGPRILREAVRGAAAAGAAAEAGRPEGHVRQAGPVVRRYVCGRVRWRTRRSKTSRRSGGWRRSGRWS